MYPVWETPCTQVPGFRSAMKAASGLAPLALVNVRSGFDAGFAMAIADPTVDPACAGQDVTV